MTPEDDPALCGIDGADGEPVTHRAFNVWARRAMIHHVTPLTKQLRDMNKALITHLQEEEVQMAKINTTIKVVGICLGILMTILNSETLLRIFHWHS